MGRHFKDWLQAYMEYTNDMESPSTFHFWTAIATVAGALRRRVWIDMRKFDWTPNFYIILVAPAGIAAKSTSISIGLNLLSQLPVEAGIHFGPESMTWQKLADSLSESTEFVKYLDQNRKEQLRAMSAVTCSILELGTFLTMEDDKLLSFLIRMWDGGDATFTHATKSSGSVEVKAPWLNLIAATTPSWLSQNFPQVMIGGGLASRILFVNAKRKRNLIPYPDEVMDLKEHEERKRKLVEDLFEISQLAGPYEILPEARTWGRNWYLTQHNGTRPEYMASERYSGYIARKQVHLHKLAMVVAAAQRTTLQIHVSDLIAADGFIKLIEPTMIETFDAIGEHEISRAVREIRTLIENSPQRMIRLDMLMRHQFHGLRTYQLKEALQTGIDMGMFTQGYDKNIPVYSLKEQL